MHCSHNFATSATQLFSTFTGNNPLQAIMADMDRAPFWDLKKGWSLLDETETRKVRFEKKGKPRSEVLPCDGTNTMEFLIALTLPQFEEAYKEQDWTAAEAYTQFAKCLTGELRVAWDETLDKEFPRDDERTDANWERAKDTFIRRYLNCKRPRDVQLRSLEHKYKKDVMEPPPSHFRRFKESLRNSLKLPQGVKADPSTEEVKEWYFGTFCKQHRRLFLTSGVGKDDLANSTMEEITDYMRLLYDTDMADGTVAKFLIHKERSRNGQQSRNGGSKPYRRNAAYSQRRDANKWDRRKDGSPDRKSYRSNGSSRNGRESSRRSHDDRRKPKSSYDSRRGRDDKRERRPDKKPEHYRSDKQDCKLHRPCKHTYEECSQNPRNQKKKSYSRSSSRREESHHQDHDESSVASSRSSRSEASSHSSSHSRSDDSSHSADNFHAHGSFTESDDEIKKIPRKTKKEERIPRKPKASRKKEKAVPAPNRRRHILDDSDESDDEFSGK